MATISQLTIVPEKGDSSRRNLHPPASKSGRDETCRTDDDSLAAIVTARLNGDAAAQQRLYDECHHRIFRLAARIVGLQDAPDVTQQTFLQAFRSIDQFSGGARFATWLYRLAVNESLQHLRRNRGRRYRTLDWEPMDESRDEENAEQKELLTQAIARIDPELRVILLLREVEGLSYKDIAEALQIPEGTVGSRLNRARRELRQHLLSLGFDP